VVYILSRLHELEFNFRLQITVLIATAALVTPMFSDSRIYEYFGIFDFSHKIALFIFIGTACALASVIRCWGAAYLSSYVVMAKDANQDKLIVAGPFMYLRNPLYFGDILGAGAVSLALPWQGFFIMIFFLTLHSYFLALYEEKKLAVKFGEAYEEFKTNVKRLWPRVSAYKHSQYEEFVKKYKSDWTDAILSNIYFTGIGAAFIAAAFAAETPRAMDRLAYIYSASILGLWGLFYMLYYHPRHFKKKGQDLNSI